MIAPNSGANHELEVGTNPRALSHEVDVGYFWHVDTRSGMLDWCADAITASLYIVITIFARP